MKELTAAIFAAACFFPGEAAAQSRALALLSPSPNASGWINVPALVRYVCTRGVRCPETQTVETEGAAHIVSATAIDLQGREAKTETVINFDRTAPQIVIQSPADGSATTASSIRIIAEAFDALSGVATATCNGRPATLGDRGAIQCTVPLAPGVNDIVVQASDAADNSGSAGVHITRTGPASALRITPETLSLLIGRPQAIQVIDDFGRAVADVAWRIDNNSVLEIARDGAHMITPKAPGVAVVTASHGNMTARATINVYSGPAFPANSVQWTVAGVSVVTEPDAPSAKPISTPEPLEVFIDQELGRRARLLSVGQQTGRMLREEAPPIDDAEQAIKLRAHFLGGAVFVVNSADGTSSLVRGGPSGQKAGLWRYKSTGRLSDNFAIDPEGTIAIVETGLDGSPRALIIDGKDGHVVNRILVEGPPSIYLNVRCIDHANVVRRIPTEAGPVTILPDGSLTVPVVEAEEYEDHRDCDHPTGYVRRVFSVSMITHSGEVLQTIGQYEVNAGAPAPRVVMFPVVSDGRDGQVVSWTVQMTENGRIEPHMAHLTANGREEWAVPAAGVIVPKGGDLAAVTDGTTLFAVHLLTGEVRWKRVFPGGGARIVPSAPGTNLDTVLVTWLKGTELLDDQGRPVPRH
jgi:Glucodextranase, domain B